MIAGGTHVVSPFDAGLLELSMSTRLLVGVLLGLCVGACDENTPTGPSVTTSRLTIGAVVPASGGTITSTGTPTGGMILPGTGQISIPITVSAGRELPYAQLSVYLMRADGSYCAQNLPDAPTWGPFRATDTVSVTISGFQVGAPPCVVSAIRAYLHTRNNGNLTPPNASETAAEGSATANFTIR